MKSITIHNLDARLARKIEVLAKQSKTSQNKFIKKILSEALGFSTEASGSDLERFRNTISQEEAKQFFRDTSVFEEIDDSQWPGIVD